MSKVNYRLHNNRHSIRFVAASVVMAAAFFVYGSIAFGATPTVKTSVQMVATGSEPFNTTGGTDDCTEANTFDSGRTLRSGVRLGLNAPAEDGNGGAGKEGQDSCSNNDIVRVGDTISYRIEVANNDSAADYMVSTVVLEKYNQATGALDANGTRHQEWTKLPEVCLTGGDVTAGPTSALQDTDSDGKKDTLVCNVGFSREGRVASYVATARVLSTASDGSAATLNDSVVGATATAQSESTTALTGSTGQSALASTSPVEAVVTAGFSVNLQKELLGYEKKADGTELWPQLVPKKGSDGTTDGYLAEYRLVAKYEKGSMIANGANETGGDFTASYTLFDAFTDDSTTNNGALSSGAKLYTWDSSYQACKFTSDHGASSAVVCTQPDNPVDSIGASYSTDGVNDPNFRVDINSIDTRDMDGDGNLFSVRVGVWIPKADVDGHQSCTGANAGNPCVFNYLNHVQSYNTATNTPELFNPTSTEDASGSNLLNSAGQPEIGGVGDASANTAQSDNIAAGLLDVMPNGYFSWRMTFNRTIDTNSNPALNNKKDEQLRARGQSVPLVFNIYEARGVDKTRSQVCNKIDTTQYAFVGIPEWNRFPEWPNLDGPMDPRYDEYYTGGSRLNDHLKVPFPGWVDDGRSPTKVWTIDAAKYVQVLYSANPNGTGSLQDLDETLCEDDVDGNGTPNIQLKDGTQTNPGNPVDWYEDYTAIPGGPSAVTKVRMELKVDHEDILKEAKIPAVRFVSVSGIFEMRILDTATGYGAKNYLPNYADARTTNVADSSVWLPWTDGGAPNSVFDPAASDFSYNIFSADRNILVDSHADLRKETVPKGIKVATPGQVLTYQLHPELFGQWAGSETASIIDNTPGGQEYVAGSERFSVDGGATWMTRAEYDASSPSVIITSQPISASADPAVWEFSSIDAGDQLPMIRYQSKVSESTVSGAMNNIVTLRAPNIAADTPTTDTDADGVADTGDGTGDDVVRMYTVRVVPQSSVDIVKSVDNQVYQVNQPFTTKLTYTNLSATDYANTELIDVLPFNNDSTALIGGDGSQRTPTTSYRGITELNEVRYSNGEQVYVTSANPSSLSSDPCASSNQPAGYVPSPGDLCYRAYIMNNNTLPDGATQGSGAVVWQACTMSGSPLVVANSCPISPAEVTAVRVSVPIMSASSSNVLELAITPIGNVGGAPVLANGILDASRKVVDWLNSPELGDRYTNSFSARTATMSFRVTSNDVTTTAVSGQVSGTLWWDEDEDGVIDSNEKKMNQQQVAVLDSSGDPIYRDAQTGAIVYTAQRASYESSGKSLERYIVTTGEDGQYVVRGLAAGSYTLEVITPPSAQTYDLDDGTAAANHRTVVTLTSAQDASSGVVTGVNAVSDVNFGYLTTGEGALSGVLWRDADGDGQKSDSEAALSDVKMVIRGLGGIDYSVMTGSDGSYSLVSLPLGTYTIEVDTSTLPAGFSQTYDVDNTNDGRTQVILTAASPTVESRNFAYAKSEPPVQSSNEESPSSVLPKQVTDMLSSTGVNVMIGLIGVALLVGLGVVVRRKML